MSVDGGILGIGQLVKMADDVRELSQGLSELKGLAEQGFNFSDAQILRTNAGISEAFREFEEMKNLAESLHKAKDVVKKVKKEVEKEVQIPQVIPLQDIPQALLDKNGQPIFDNSPARLSLNALICQLVREGMTLGDIVSMGTAIYSPLSTPSHLDPIMAKNLLTTQVEQLRRGLAVISQEKASAQEEKAEKAEEAASENNNSVGMGMGMGIGRSTSPYMRPGTMRPF